MLNANREAEDAITDFLRSRERAEELRKAVEAAAESVALAQLHYQQGWIDFDRVNNLQRDLATQQDAFVAAQADVAFGLIRIYRALGGGWKVFCGDTPLGPFPSAAASPDPLANSKTQASHQPTGPRVTR